MSKKIEHTCTQEKEITELRTNGIWMMQKTEKIYLELLKTSSPQAARTVLPNSCKTEIIVFANLLQWQHIFRLRTPPAAEPSMREIMIPLHAEFVKMFPAVFAEGN